MGRIVDSDGYPLVINPDMRVPVEQGYEQLGNFSEVEYLSGLARFITANTGGRLSAKDVIQLYDNQEMTGVHNELINILMQKTGMDLGDIDGLPRPKVLEMLYKLGCPQMYVFHKTAVESWDFMERNWLKPNPLARDTICVTNVYEYAAHYKRRDDKFPYIMAIPLMDAIKAEDNYYDNQGSPMRGSELAVTIMPFHLMKDGDRQGLLKRLKVFALDPNRYSKYSQFKDRVGID